MGRGCGSRGVANIGIWIQVWGLGPHVAPPITRSAAAQGPPSHPFLKSLQAAGRERAAAAEWSEMTQCGWLPPMTHAGCLSF